MTFIPMSLENIQVMAQNDAQELRRIIYWLAQRSKIYSQNMTTQNMTTATISPADQSTMLGFIADINKLYTFATSSTQLTGNDMLFDCDAMLGIL
jgi:hypothetical protein